MHRGLTLIMIFKWPPGLLSDLLDLLDYVGTRSSTIFEGQVGMIVLSPHAYGLGSTNKGSIVSLL